ncbi:MAG TPA: M14 metallopeptidase family protein [Gemmatirosa sp.]
MRIAGILRTVCAGVGLVAGARAARAQGAPDGAPVPTPSQVTGLAIGADRTLADWAQITGYFAALAGASPYVRMDTLGPTTEGRPFVMATITAPANLRRIAEIRAAQARLADPRGLGVAEEARLVARQPAVVMISCNIHSTEIGASQMAMELAYRLATVDTLRRALDSVVVLLVPSMNPDGEQMVVDWYRRGLGTPFEGGPLPFLYHPYTGHDNNRDWYMVTQRETRLVTDVLYRRWFPEVFYDVHQQGTDGMRITLPPHTEPIDPNVDPLIVRGINHIGAEMALALEARGKTGVGSGATYDLWWHGGARSAPTRHNMVGLLSEAASARIATPITITAADLRGGRAGAASAAIGGPPRVNLPSPWAGGTWRLRDIMDYESIAGEALVKMLARQRGDYVANFVALGRKAVALGAAGGPWAYVLPAGQADAHAVARLVEVLRVGGVDVDRATAAFTAGGRAYEAGSYVVRMAQPYRAHAKDLLEPQRFPRIESYPGGPPQRPYDVAGWTLPYQFGVRADAVDSAFAVASVPVAGVPAAGTLDSTTLARCAVRRAHGSRRRSATLDAANTACYRFAFAAGAGQVVRIGGETTAIAIREAPRVALYRPWTANMDEGWTRWVLEQYGVRYATLTDSAARAGALRTRYDVVVVPDMSLRDAREGMSAREVPAAYAGGLGEAGLAALRTFVEEGGTLVLVDRATEIASGPFGLPITRITVPRAASDVSGGEDPAAAGGDALYAPGSILRVLVDRTQPLALGMPDTAAVYFTNSTTLDVSRAPGAQVVARYPERADDILMSGFLSGGARIAGRAALAEVPMGRGRVVLFGFRPLYRAQSIGTFRLLFNALLASVPGSQTASTPGAYGRR